LAVRAGGGTQDQAVSHITLRRKETERNQKNKTNININEKWDVSALTQK
jgi:hypothetical protein